MPTTKELESQIETMIKERELIINDFETKMTFMKILLNKQGTALDKTKQALKQIDCAIALADYEKNIRFAIELKLVSEHLQKVIKRETKK